MRYLIKLIVPSIKPTETCILSNQLVRSSPYKAILRKRNIEVVRRIKWFKEQVESNNKKERSKEVKSDIKNKVINNYK